jgi:pimeloyl-ACP methyl ester carboxylesterase
MAVLVARGCTFYVEDKGVGPPVLLIPPSGSTAGTWGALPAELGADARVIAYDRRGYVRSGGQVVRTASVHAADAIALLEALQATPAVVVGTSAGASIALDVAVRRPDLVHAVISHEAPWRALAHPDITALTTLARMGARTARGRHDEATEILLRYVYGYRDGGTAWDAFPEQWRRIARENGRQVIADLIATTRSYPSAADLATVSLPVVCSYGARSREFMQAVTRSLAQAIPTARLHQVERAAHAVAFDNPHDFAALILDAARTPTAR